MVANGEGEITADLVAELLREQHPDLAGLPVTFGARGWDSQLWRLGDHLAVRMPWATPDADELVRREHALVPALAARLPLPVPVPQRLGQPSPRFPRHWIVTTWVAGEPADVAPATRGPEAAETLAAFLAAMHEPAPAVIPPGRHNRAGPLADSSEGFARLLQEASRRGLVSDPDAVRQVWEDALAAPAWTGPRLWLHGDGTFCGVVDFGDLCAGDPACDLAACWLVLPDGCIDRFHQSYAPAADAATVRRARGRAAGKALACLLIGDDGVHGRPGGKPAWGPPAEAALRRLTATRP
jgi:aminoglycoside phosphotransferase (APT) family kinase protein